MLLLEARNRIAGRAWTTFDLAPYPIELGAEYYFAGEHTHPNRFATLHGAIESGWFATDKMIEQTIS